MCALLKIRVGSGVFRAGDAVGVVWIDSAHKLRVIPGRVLRVVIDDPDRRHCRYRVALSDDREILCWGYELGILPGKRVASAKP